MPGGLETREFAHFLRITNSAKIGRITFPFLMACNHEIDERVRGKPQNAKSGWRTDRVQQEERYINADIDPTVRSADMP
jgi:hypothetical protein